MQDYLSNEDIPEVSLIEELTQQEYATIQQLKKAGIKRKFDLGLNNDGNRDVAIIDSNYNQWDYSHDESIYKLRRVADPVLLNSL